MRIDLPANRRTVEGRDGSRHVGELYVPVDAPGYRQPDHSSWGFGAPVRSSDDHPHDLPHRALQVYGSSRAL